MSNPEKNQQQPDPAESVRQFQADLDARFGHILPEGCGLRGRPESGVVAAIMLRKHLAEECERREVEGFKDPNYELLLQSVALGKAWRLPAALHNAHCICDRQVRDITNQPSTALALPPTRVAVPAPLPSVDVVHALLVEMNLPTKEAPETEAGITLYAEIVGAPTHPCIELKCYAGPSFEGATSRASAFQNPRTGQWSILVFHPGSPFGTELTPTDDHAFARATIRRLVEKAQVRT